MMRKWIACFSVLLLSACAAPLQIQGGKLVPPPGHGYVIAAVTLDSLDHNYADAGIRLDGPAGKIYLDAEIMMHRIRAPGDEPDGIGKLHVVPLPAGRYRVSELYGSWMDDTFNWMSFRSHSRFVLNETFDLAAGQVAYLGDYHISLNFQPSYARSDTRRRDFNELAARRGVNDFSNITVLLPQMHTNK